MSTPSSVGNERPPDDRRILYREERVMDLELATATAEEILAGNQVADQTYLSDQFGYTVTMEENIGRREFNPPIC
jgi:hypothetical protein